jgi:hypothetical protein
MVETLADKNYFKLSQLNYYLKIRQFISRKFSIIEMCILMPSKKTIRGQDTTNMYFEYV